MKLYKILLRHCAPKDCVEVTKLYVLADNDDGVMARLDAEEGHYTYGAWKEKSNDAEEPFDIYDDHYNIIGTETYIERMLRLRGEFNDENADYGDAYYGVRHWGWDKGVDLSNDDANILLRLNIVEDWRSNENA